MIHCCFRGLKVSTLIDRESAERRKVKQPRREEEQRRWRRQEKQKERRGRGEAEQGDEETKKSEPDGGLNTRFITL